MKLLNLFLLLFISVFICASCVKERSLYNVLYSLYNVKYMKIPELIDLINEFVFGKDLATEEKLNEKQKKSKASNIKRQYNMLIQNKKAHTFLAKPYH